MDSADIVRQRLHSQRLVGASKQTPAELVAHMGAVQKKNYAGAEWAVSLRVPTATDASLEETLIRRQMLRTWALRRTLHLLAAQGMRWLLTLVAPRVIAANKRRYAGLALNEQTFTASNRLIVRALQQQGVLDPSGHVSDLPAKMLYEVPRARGFQRSFPKSTPVG